LALGVFVAVGALVGARPAAASTIAVHTLQSGIVHIASAGERAELHLLNASPYARNVKLELIDAAGLTKSVTSTVVQSGGQATISFDPTKMTLVRGRILLNQQDGETEIQCNDFVASLEIVAAGDTPRTKVYVGDFNHIDP
jgi:hypothetical protein